MWGKHQWSACGPTIVRRGHVFTAKGEPINLLGSRRDEEGYVIGRSSWDDGSDNWKIADGAGEVPAYGALPKVPRPTYVLESSLNPAPWGTWPGALSFCRSREYVWGWGKVEEGRDCFRREGEP